jgi:hypothetical protein
MGVPNPGLADIALMQPQTVAVTSATTFNFPRQVQGTYNLTVSGTFVATVQLERSFDGGVTYAPISGATLGTTATFTGPTTLVGVETERGVLYRVNCTAYTSGTANVRISG